METYEKHSKLFKVLMHPTRLAILEILRGGEECVCHMEAALGLRQAYISQQLMVLREAGLIQDRRDGWNIFYRVIKPEIYAVLDSANVLTGDDHDDAKQSDLRQRYEFCECPKCRTELSHAS
ncbi:MAG TPA: metalloregulator ArsR/SmtB family transcription factor [Anaerolineales bacterium]